MIAAKYELQETPRKDYPQRTEWNVRDSDGTVIFTLAAKLSGGSKKTQGFAIQHRKPVIHLSASMGVDRAALALRAFVEEHHIHDLNVAGSRASKEPAVCDWVTAVLDRL